MMGIKADFLLMRPDHYVGRGTPIFLNADILQLPFEQLSPLWNSSSQIYRVQIFEKNSAFFCAKPLYEFRAIRVTCR